MEPALVGTRLASAAIGPLLRKLLAGDVPGAGPTGHARTVRLSALVSFRGEKRTLTEWACVHILECFTRRPGFVPRTLVEQSHRQAELGARLD